MMQFFRSHPSLTRFAILTSALAILATSTPNLLARPNAKKPIPALAFGKPGLEPTSQQFSQMLEYLTTEIAQSLGPQFPPQMAREIALTPMPFLSLEHVLSVHRQISYLAGRDDWLLVKNQLHQDSVSFLARSLALCPNLLLSISRSIHDDPFAEGKTMEIPIQLVDSSATDTLSSPLSQSQILAMLAFFNTEKGYELARDWPLTLVFLSSEAGAWAPSALNALVQPPIFASFKKMRASDREIKGPNQDVAGSLAYIARLDKAQAGAIYNAISREPVSSLFASDPSLYLDNVLIPACVCSPVNAAQAAWAPINSAGAMELYRSNPKLALSSLKKIVRYCGEGAWCALIVLAEPDAGEAFAANPKQFVKLAKEFGPDAWRAFREEGEKNSIGGIRTIPEFR
jgi:hypothetical protein